MIKQVAYDNMLIEPKYSDVMSRSDVELKSNIGSLQFELPIISSNMKCVTGPVMVAEMHRYGGLGVLHRFWSIEDNIDAFCECATHIDPKYVGVSVGVTEDEYNRFDKLKECGAVTFCIDVAHGHHKNMHDMIKYIRDADINNEFTIIAGTVATHEGARDLYMWGTDIIKVGIGSGSACLTRRNTGVGVPQLQAIKDIKYAHPEIPIIADGGCRTGRHITIALAAGADLVMLGSILAGTIETPGLVYPNDDSDLVNRTYYKIYHGSASIQNDNENKFVEGKMMKIPFKGHVKYILKEIKENIQSACSYSGCHSLKEFQENAKLIQIDNVANIESST